MDTSIYLIDHAIQKKNPTFRTLSEDERERRILTLLNYGFVWNPYYEEFDNPFLNMKGSSELVNFNVSEIKEHINSIRVSFKSFEEIQKKIYWDQSNRLLRKIDVWTSTVSIIYGLIFWATGAILIFFSDLIIFANSALIIGTALIYYWVTYHILFLRVATRAEQPPLMYKNEGLMRLLRVGSLGLTLFMLLWLNESPSDYILVSTGFAIILFANYCISKSLISYWWCFKGFQLLKQYYNTDKIKH